MPAPTPAFKSARDFVLDELPFAREPEFEVCIVGTTALAEACVRCGQSRRPAARDIDLAWRPEGDEALAILARYGFSASQTSGSEARGTLGIRSAKWRFELTSFRGGGDSPSARIRNDALGRDMTIGAVLWRLHDDTIHDPQGGVGDWQRGILRACGNAVERIEEHPVRILRYLRRAAELGFTVEEATRSALRTRGAAAIAHILPEAAAEELRRVLAGVSPGLFFAFAYEERLLSALAPELEPLFDGRPAGRLRWHPEQSQGLHTILTLKIAAALADRSRLAEAARRRLILGVLCHDLGKGLTERHKMPSHPGHDAAGVPLVSSLLDRFPSLADRRARRFCEVVARNHLTLAQLRHLRAGTLVELWERDLAPMREDFPLLAAAVRADREGRLPPDLIGLPTRPGADFDGGALERRVVRDLEALDAILREVRGDEAVARHPRDPVKLRAMLHEMRSRAIHAAGFRNDEA